MMKTPYMLMTQKQSGQSLMMIAMVMSMLMVGAVGYSLVQMNSQNTDATMTYKQQTQSYLLAKAGLDEALATRLIPRSNQLTYRTNFVPNNFIAQVTNGSLRNNTWSVFGVGPYNQAVNFNTNIFPFYQGSGRVNEDVQNPNTPVLGYYRYMVVGGTLSRKAADGSYYNADNPNDDNLRANANQRYSQLVENEYFRNDGTPFIVVSNGFTCTQNGSMAAPNAVIPPNGLGAPRCANGTVPDQTTLVMPLTMEVMSNPDSMNRQANPDQTMETRIYKGPAFQLPRNFDGNFMRVSVPGVGLVWSGQNIDFQTMWNANQRLSSKLNGIVFFNSATRQVIGRPIVFCDTGTGQCPQGFANNPIRLWHNSASQQVARQINEFVVTSNASIKLFFDGPIDFRSPYNYQINGTNGAGQNCSNNREFCKIHLSNGNNLLDLRDFNFIPIFPSNSEILVSPTYEAGGLNRLIISGMRDYAGKVDGPNTDLPRTYDLRFTVVNN
jgi:type II secretory pathway pseudopilin PulG